MSKLTNKEGARPFNTRLERQFATFCLHEAAHTVTAVAQAISVTKALVFDERKGKIKPDSLAYRRFIESDDNLLAAVESGILPGGGAFPELDENTPIDSMLAFIHAPESVEKSVAWTDKSQISVHVTADQHAFDTIARRQPRFSELFQVWKLEEQNMLALQPIWDAIEKISDYLREKEKINNPEILSLTLEPFISSLDKATCADDFLVESYKGSPVPFEILKMYVIEGALNIYVLSINIYKKSQSPIDPAFLQRYMALVGEYQTLLEERGPSIVNLGSP